MAGLVEGEVTTGLREEKCEYKWRIQNWMRVQQRKDFLESQKFLIDTGNTKWEVGLVENPKQRNEYMYYWKLLAGCGYTTGKEVQYAITFLLLYPLQLSPPLAMFRRDDIIKVNESHTAEGTGWGFKPDYEKWSSVMDSDGSLCLLICLTQWIPSMVASVSVPKRLTPVETSFRLSHKMKNNLAAALNDPSLYDLKIVTKDKKEFGANLFILKIQCPLFAAQFNKGSKGIINLDDISGKTLGILLRLFYTEDLLPSWRDADTIVEFTQAAGKYQLTDILEMLDSVLGTTDKKETSDNDFQLMNLANKLGLKNAEARLLERVKMMTVKFTSAEQFLALFDNMKINDSSQERNLQKKANK